MSGRIGIALIAVAIALLITASAGTSVVSMDRSIAVEVVDDEDANVAVEPVEVTNEGESANESDTAADATTQADDEEELLTVTNRFADSIEVTAFEAPSGVEIEAEGTEIEPGESTSLEGTVDCDELESEPEATVELDGSGVTISQTVDLEVGCSDASV
ncbi:hypothetical protein [Natronococcus roseus]|uniref:hypothetical protein n=1 Tax=Natronococcus roseus TaxID=1052014 RepID=UPI00374DDDD7